MIKGVLTLLIGWLGISLTSCQRADEELAGERSSSQGGFVLNYTVPQSRVVTYGTVQTETGEDLVNSLYVLFFRETTGGTGEFLGYYQVPTEDEYGNLTPLSSQGQIRVDFKDVKVTEDPLADTPVTFDPDGIYSLLLVANAGDFLEGQDVLEWISEMRGKSENVVLGTSLLRVEGTLDEQDNSHSIHRDNLPMGARVKRAAGQKAVSVELRRSVFRVDVRNVATGYELVSASIWNAYPTTPAWENVLTAYKSPRVTRLYGVTDVETAIGEQSIKSGLYAFENGTSLSTNSDSVSTCLILGFRKNSKTFYYRANINITDVGQRLQRNNAYRITVKGIQREGESCELDAYTSGKFLLDLTVNEWNVDDQGNLLSNGVNVLAVPTDNIIFTPAAETRSYSIYTAGPGTLELSQAHLPAGITVNLEGNTLTVAVTANAEARGGYIELRLGELKAVITIKQTGDTDKYLTLNRYSVPTFPGNGIFQMQGDVQVTSSGPWSAKIYGEGFTFQYRVSPAESPREMLHYPSGYAFSITSLGTNPELDPRYAFISIHLDEDPGISQVLVLAQSGQTSYEFDPPLTDAEKSITFNALGAKTAGGRDPYKVIVGGDGKGEWKVLVPAAHADRFLVRYYNAEGVLQPGATSLFGPGSFKIEANKYNTTGSVINAALDVILMDNAEGSRQTINVTQNVFVLTFTGTPVANISAMGGAMATSVGVQLSPAWSGASWSAAVTSTNVTGHAAYFGATPGTTTGSGAITDKVTLTYPKLPFARARLGAETVVTVTAAGVSANFTIQQSIAPWRALNVVTYNDGGYGSLADGPANPTYFNHFHTCIRTASYIGTAGVVRTASPLVFKGQTSPLGEIHNSQCRLLDHLDDTFRGNIVSWLKSAIPALHNAPANFLIVAGDDWGNYASRWKLLTSVLGKDCYVPSDETTARTAAPAPTEGTAARKVWDYIMVNGPFGSVNTADLIFYTDDETGYLNSNRPASTVPLLRVGTANRADVAIDPEKRLLFIGSVEFFGTFRNGDSKGLLNAAQYSFMLNIMAFMINSAQYGEYFLSDFK
jgi:hypothetical protein